MRRLCERFRAGRPPKRHAGPLFAAWSVAAWGVAACALAACEGGHYATALDVAVVNGSGGNPAADVVSGTLTVHVRQGSATAAHLSTPIAGGRFELTLPITSYAGVTRLAVELAGDDDTRRLGALPPFVPLFYSPVRVVVGAPASCVALNAPTLGMPRAGAALVPFDANLLALGGLDAAGDGSTDVELLSPIQLTVPTATVRYPDPLSLPLGEALALRLADTSRLVALDAARALVFETSADATGTRDTTLTLHAGAGPRSALVDLGASGVAVVGGLRGPSPSRGVSFVGENGAVSVIESLLAFPRANPAVARLGDGLLVAGGQEPGAPLFEWVPLAPDLRATEHVVVFGEGLAPRAVASLAVSPDGDAALLALGQTADARALEDTLVVRGCPTRCAVSPGPVAPAPRWGAGRVVRADGTLFVGGETEAGPSASVERVEWAAGEPRFVAEAGLVTPRARAAVVPFAAGVVLVGGGLGERPLDDLELCFPPALDAL